MTVVDFTYTLQRLYPDDGHYRIVILVGRSGGRLTGYPAHTVTLEGIKNEALARALFDDLKTPEGRAGVLGDQYRDQPFDEIHLERSPLA